MSLDELRETPDPRDRWSVILRATGTGTPIPRAQMLDMTAKVIEGLGDKLTSFSIAPYHAEVGLRLYSESIEQALDEAVSILRTSAHACGLPQWPVDWAQAISHRATSAPTVPSDHSSLFGTPTLEGQSPPQTCDPPGPPYVPICSEGFYYYPLGNLIEAVPNADAMINGSPGKHVANLSNGCTAVLIGRPPTWLLTAAHCVTPKSDGISVSLAQWGKNCRPYGTVPVLEAHIPQEWFDNPGGSYNSPQTRAYDWALLKVPDLSLIPAVPGAPPPEPMTMASPAVHVGGVTTHTMGYGCGRSASGTLRQVDKPYTTHLADEHGVILGRTDFPSTGFLKGGGGIIRATVEATGGFSGGPLWVRRDRADHLVGVMIGSPQSVCESGEIWAAALTPMTLSRILAVAGDGSPANMVKFEYDTLSSAPSKCTT